MRLIFENWRGVDLISGFIMLERLKKKTKNTRAVFESRALAGFRCGKCSLDVMLTPTTNIGEINEWSNKTYMLLIDFVKAFDSMN